MTETKTHYLHPSATIISNHVLCIGFHTHTHAKTKAVRPPPPRQGWQKKAGRTDVDGAVPGGCARSGARGAGEEAQGAGEEGGGGSEGAGEQHHPRRHRHHRHQSTQDGVGQLPDVLAHVRAAADDSRDAAGHHQGHAAVCGPAGPRQRVLRHLAVAEDPCGHPPPARRCRCSQSGPPARRPVSSLHPRGSAGQPAGAWRADTPPTHAPRPSDVQVPRAVCARDPGALRGAGAPASFQHPAKARQRVLHTHQQPVPGAAVQGGGRQGLCTEDQEAHLASAAAQHRVLVRPVRSTHHADRNHHVLLRPRPPRRAGAVVGLRGARRLSRREAHAVACGHARRHQAEPKPQERPVVHQRHPVHRRGRRHVGGRRVPERRYGRGQRPDGRVEGRHAVRQRVAHRLPHDQACRQQSVRIGSRHRHAGPVRPRPHRTGSTGSPHRPGRSTRRHLGPLHCVRHAVHRHGAPGHAAQLCCALLHGTAGV